MQMKNSRRAGFTLIELLVVISVVAVLVTLLLPAIGGVRAAARRTQCSNNLMQLSIAVQNYEAAHGVFPPGVVDPNSPVVDLPTGYHVSWVVRILPYFEQKPLYDSINMTLGVYHPANATARAVQVDGLLCPADTTPNASPTTASTNYAGCHNDIEAPIDTDNHGVFFLNTALRYEDIEDGTSYTLFLGEKLRSNTDLGWVSGTRATLRNTGTAINGPPPVPTTKNPSPVGGFGSSHGGPSGTNFAFGDGGVRFLTNSTDLHVLQALGHRADGQLISSDRY